MPAKSRVFCHLARVCILLACAVCLILPAREAEAARESLPDFSSLQRDLGNLPDQELASLLVFVSGNALFALYHEVGHMLISELHLPVSGQEEDLVENLATISMLGNDSDDIDLLLTNAMVGLFLVADDTHPKPEFYTAHDLDRERGFRMLCLMVGADEDAFRDLAIALELPEERIESCYYDYEKAAEAWDLATENHVRDSEFPAGRIKVIHDPSLAGFDLLATFVEETGLLEQIARGLDTLYDLPEDITFRSAACGAENAYWDPDKREIVLCHELLGAMADLYMSLPHDDN